MIYTHIIYKLTFPNGKIYIGQTGKDFEKYMNNYKNKSLNKNDKEYNRPICRAIRKYDWDNVKKEILFTISEEFVDELETRMIAKYKSANKNFGYNILKEAKTMRGFKHSEKSKEKIRKNHNIISKSNNPMWGKHHSKETIQLMREAKLGKSNFKKYKAIDVYTKTMEYIKAFESIKKASEELDIPVQNIISVLKYRRKTAGNYIFKYSEK